LLIYILENLAGQLYIQLYIGQTNDLQRRLNQHNDTARSGWTANRGPWKIIFSESAFTRVEGMKKERYLKSLKNKARIRAYIAGWRKSTSQGS